MNWLLLKNSLLVAGMTTLLSASLGFVAALCQAGLAVRWRRLLLSAAVIALALPPFLVTNCWLHFLGYTGVWRGWLPLNIISFGGAIWILTLLTWPISFLAVGSAWGRLEPSQLESDPLVSAWALIRALLWPLARAGLAQAALLTFVLALNNFAVPAILQVKVFPAEMWVRFNTTFDTLGALRLSWPLVLGPLLLLIWFARREITWPAKEGAVSPRLFRQQLGPAWFFACGACTIALCLLAVGLPIFQLVSVKRTWTELPGALAAGQAAVWNSVWFAAAAATAVLGLALAAGTPRRFSGFRGRGARSSGATSDSRERAEQRTVLPPEGGVPIAPSRLVARAKYAFRARRSRASFKPFNFFNSFNSLSVWLWLPFLVPGVLLGIGLITVFNRPVLSRFYQSAGIVIMAFVIRYLALGWTTVALALRATDPDLTDFARLNGATRWQMLRYVFWPQIAPRAAASWHVVFLLCLWDVESMILVVPPGGETLALRVFNLLHYGHNAQVNALCLTLLVVAAVPLLLWRLWSVIRNSLPRISNNASRFTFHVSGITRHTTRITLFVAVLLLAGCAPQSPSNQAPVPSQIFRRVQIIGSRGVGVGELNKPRSVAVDAQDNLYVVDMTGRVQKFSPNGSYLLSWQMPQTDLGKPKGMCRDREGNIVVVEPHYQRINHFSPDGRLVAQWGERGTNAGQLSMPRAVAVNSRGEIFVSEYGAVERVQNFAFRARAVGTAPEPSDEPPGFGVRQSSAAFQSYADPSEKRQRSAALQDADALKSFQYLSTFGHPGTGPGEFNRPEGLCVDAHDRLYVADSCNHRIQVFSSDGAFLRAYGKPGTGKGQLSYPYDICVDREGRQYVCEFGNSRIQVFDANDQPIEIIGRAGAEPGQFSNPWGVALDAAGNLYVADSQNHRVQKFVRKDSGVGSQEPGAPTRSVVSSQWSVAEDHGRRATDYGRRILDFRL